MVFAVRTIIEIAKEMNAEVVLEPTSQHAGYVRFASGKKIFFRGSHLDINPLGASEISKNKAYTKFFLKEGGFSVPEGIMVYSERKPTHIPNALMLEDGFEWVKKMGYPVVLKPNNGTQGYHVMRVNNDEQYMQCAQEIFSIYASMMVESWYIGKDYRVVILDGELMAAYERIPLFVEGDGVSTIEELFTNKLLEQERQNRPVLIKKEDTRLQLRLEELGYGWDTVLEKDTRVHLLNNANLSTGGEPVDVSEEIHPDFIDLAVRITGHMGLRLCGVDILTKDITQPLVDYVVLEINQAPQVDHFSCLGEGPSKRAYALYRKILQKLEAER